MTGTEALALQAAVRADAAFRAQRMAMIPFLATDAEGNLTGEMQPAIFADAQFHALSAAMLDAMTELSVALRRVAQQEEHPVNEIVSYLVAAYQRHTTVLVTWKGYPLPPLRVERLVLDGDPSARLTDGNPDPQNPVVLILPLAQLTPTEMEPRRD